MTDGGIILNNALSNFFTPSEEAPSLTANRMAEGQRPLTQNVVALAMDTSDVCGRRYMFGGATADAVGQVMVEPLLDNMDMKTAIDKARILFRNDTLFVEGASDLGQQAIQELKETYKGESKMLMLPYTSVNGMEKTLDTVLRYSDWRS